MTIYTLKYVFWMSGRVFGMSGLVFWVWACIKYTVIYDSNIKVFADLGVGDFAIFDFLKIPYRPCLGSHAGIISLFELNVCLCSGNGVRFEPW